jgi:hypothetical protein
MAAQTSLMLESSESLSCGGNMGIMAGGTAHDAFLESVPFVELELGKNIFMAGVAAF